MAGEKAVEAWVFPKRQVHRDTPLVAKGKAIGAVVYPARPPGYKALAERIGAAVQQATGVALPLLADEAVVPEWCGAPKPEFRRTPLVVLGDINANRAAFPLYARYLCQCDANYPGKGGRVLRTVFAPYHMAANHVVLAGPGLAETTAAVERFLELVRKHGKQGELAVPPLLDIRLGDAWREMEQRAAREKVRASGLGASAQAAAAAKRTLLTGHQAPAQSVRNWFLERAKVPKGFVTSDYSMEALARAWELTCDSGLYSPDELQDIETKLLHTLFYQQNQYWRRHGPAESLGTRHQMAGSFAFLVLAEALRRHCPGDTPVAARLDKWIAEVKAYYRCFPARRSYHDERDSNSTFQCMGLLFNYALREGELEVFTNGTARHGIRKAIACIDNLGYGAGLQNYEDTYPGHVRTAYLVGEPLALAAFYYRDPHMKWLVQNWPGCQFSTWFAHGHGIEHAFATDESLVPQPPTGADFQGFVPAAALGDRHRRTVAAGRTAVPYAHTFDKLALREAFDPQATYLAVQGMEPLIDWRDDANAIIRMTERGRICLFHNNKWPSRFHKNGVLVSPGYGLPPPRAARLDLVANFPDAAFSQSTLPAYRGTDWTRRILWAARRFTVVLDDVVVREPGDYSATCVWRTPVASWLDGRRWTSRERGIDFHVVGDAVVPATTVPEPMVGWEVGLRGSGVRQIQHAKARRGHVLRFRNLLYTAGAADPKALDVRRISHSAVLVAAKGGATWLAGFDGFAGPSIETNALMFLIGPTGACLAQGTTLRVGGEIVWRADKRTDATVELKGDVAAKALAALWPRAANPEVVPPPSKATDGPMRVAWSFDGVARPPKPIPGIGVTSLSGEPKGLEFIANGELGGRWSGQSARFEAAPDLRVDLHAPRRVRGLRVWTRETGPRPPSDPKPVEAHVALSDRADLAGAKETAMALKPGHRFCELYKTQLHAVPFLESTALDARARFLRLRLPDTVRAIGELEVLGDEWASPEALDVCTAELDGTPPAELVVTTRLGEVLALSADGTKLWSRRVPGDPLALAAGDYDGDGLDEVMVSALDGGLHWFDGDGAEHRIAPWPQRFGCLQYDLAFGPAEQGKSRPLYTSSYYDAALLRHGAKPHSQFFYSMWAYDLLPPTRDLDGKGGPDLVAHDIYGRTTMLDTDGLRVGPVWSTVRGRLSHWQLIERPGQPPALLVVGWDGLALYAIKPGEPPHQLWRHEDCVRHFCALVAGDRILVGKADGFVAEFGLDGTLRAAHWVGWPVKALAQVGTNLLVGTDGGLRCYDAKWTLRQTLPGACTKLLPIASGDKAAVIALFLDGKVQKLELVGR